MELHECQRCGADYNYRWQYMMMTPSPKKLGRRGNKHSGKVCEEEKNENFDLAKYVPKLEFNRTLEEVCGSLVLFFQGFGLNK